MISITGFNYIVRQFDTCESACLFFLTVKKTGGGEAAGQERRGQSSTGGKALSSDAATNTEKTGPAQDPAGPGCTDNVLSITVWIVAHLFSYLNYFSIIFFLRGMALQPAIAIGATTAPTLGVRSDIRTLRNFKHQKSSQLSPFVRMSDLTPGLEPCECAPVCSPANRPPRRFLYWFDPRHQPRGNR